MESAHFVTLIFFELVNFFGTHCNHDADWRRSSLPWWSTTRIEQDVQARSGMVLTVHGQGTQTEGDQVSVKQDYIALSLPLEASIFLLGQFTAKKFHVSAPTVQRLPILAPEVDSSDIPTSSIRIMTRNRKRGNEAMIINCPTTMPKNKGKGVTNCRRGKNENDFIKRELDGKKKLCQIREKLCKKVWINVGDIILVGRGKSDSEGFLELKFSNIILFIFYFVNSGFFK